MRVDLLFDCSVLSSHSMSVDLLFDCSVGLFYRSPSSNESVNEKLCTTFREIGSCNFKDVLIFGDFNFPEIDWKTESCTAGTGHAAYRFLESTRDAFLTQHQCEPTRYRYGQRSNILDLVFTSR